MKYMKNSLSPLLKIALLIYIAMTGLPSLLSAQIIEKLPTGMGIEIGGGHNQFFWDSQVEGTYDRTAFSFMPAIRIHYVIPIVSNMGIYSFLGYNEFGGRSGEEHYVQRGQVKVKDRIRIQNLETGLFGLYKISNFRFGAGVKVNRHLKISDRHGNWRGVNIILIENSDMIRDWSYDGGIRAEYMSNTGITFGAEGWIGLSNLAIENGEDIPSYYPNHDWESMKIRQNHFRLLVGFRFK